jgi:hypothetical protein
MFRDLGVKPLQLVIACEDGAILLPAVRIVGLLGVDAVQLGGRAVVAADEDAGMDIGRTGVGQSRDAELAEEVDAVGGDGSTHRRQVLDGEVCEVGVLQVLLWLRCRCLDVVGDGESVCCQVGRGNLRQQQNTLAHAL